MLIQPHCWDAYPIEVDVNTAFGHCWPPPIDLEWISALDAEGFESCFGAEHPGPNHQFSTEDFELDIDGSEVEQNLREAVGNYLDQQLGSYVYRFFNPQPETLFAHLEPALRPRLISTTMGGYKLFADPALITTVTPSFNLRRWVAEHYSGQAPAGRTSTEHRVEWIMYTLDPEGTQDWLSDLVTAELDCIQSDDLVWCGPAPQHPDGAR